MRARRTRVPVIHTLARITRHGIAFDARGFAPEVACGFALFTAGDAFPFIEIAPSLALSATRTEVTVAPAPLVRETASGWDESVRMASLARRGGITRFERLKMLKELCGVTGRISRSSTSSHRL